MARTPLEQTVLAQVKYITLFQTVKWIHADSGHYKDSLGLPPISDVATFVKWHGSDLCAKTTYGGERIRTFVFDANLCIWQDRDPGSLAFSYIEVPALVADAFRRTVAAPPRCAIARPVNPTTERPTKTTVATSVSTSFMSKFAASLGLTKPVTPVVAGRAHPERKK